MDHNRQDGEGVGPQEYTGIKMKVKQWSEAAAKTLPEGIQQKKVYLVAATLRPESMYGQTNYFIRKEITYGLYMVKDDAVFLCTHRAIRNMAFRRKRVEQFGAETAFNRTLPSDKAEVLREPVPYMKRNVGYIDVDVVFADESAGKTGPGYSRTLQSPARLDSCFGIREGCEVISNSVI
ncbi:cytosolic leucyl tRNA synthetase [Ceratobasidium sp. 428]|nr:cytosolic leucyl tRNA synthetase [Ceratobasidium sp. 428]